MPRAPILSMIYVTSHGDAAVELSIPCQAAIRFRIAGFWRFGNGGLAFRHSDLDSRFRGRGLDSFRGRELDSLEVARSFGAIMTRRRRAARFGL